MTIDYEKPHLSTITPRKPSPGMCSYLDHGDRMDVPIDLGAPVELAITRTDLGRDETAREVDRVVKDRAREEDVEVLRQVRQLDRLAGRSHQILPCPERLGKEGVHLVMDDRARLAENLRL